MVPALQPKPLGEGVFYKHLWRTLPQRPIDRIKAWAEFWKTPHVITSILGILRQFGKLFQLRPCGMKGNYFKTTFKKRNETVSRNQTFHPYYFTGYNGVKWLFWLPMKHTVLLGYPSAFKFTVVLCFLTHIYCRVKTKRKQACYFSC